MLTLSQLSKSFAGRTLFSDVSLQINREDRIGLVGPNGAGKSTLFSLILGDASPDGLYLPPGAGTVDYKLLASYLPRLGAQLPGVVELDSSIAPGELPSIRACLDKHGL